LLSCCLPADCPLLAPIVSKGFRASAPVDVGYAHLEIESNQVSIKYESTAKSWNILTL
jgi:hypothetical protein